MANHVKNEFMAHILVIEVIGNIPGITIGGLPCGVPTKGEGVRIYDEGIKRLVHRVNWQQHAYLGYERMYPKWSNHGHLLRMHPQSGMMRSLEDAQCHRHKSNEDEGLRPMIGSSVSRCSDVFS